MLANRPLFFTNNLAVIYNNIVHARKEIEGRNLLFDNHLHPIGPNP